MKISGLPLSSLCLVAAGWLGTATSPAFSPASATPQDAPPVAKVAEGERTDMQPRVSDLDFLAGVWKGSDGQSEWESCYSTGAGGQLVGASKEMRGGRVVMMDFEHFYEVDGEMRMRPFPFGERSVEFTLVKLEGDKRRAVFANLEHDFPKSFIYHRTGEKTLQITLQGELGGQDARFVLEFTKQDV
jgi:hypothetical protein